MGSPRDWVRDCGGKPVWCNPPYRIVSVLPQWVECPYPAIATRLHEGGVLAYCRIGGNCWFQIVKGSCRGSASGGPSHPQRFGPKAGKQCGNLPPENLKASWQFSARDEKGFCSNWLDDYNETRDSATDYGTRNRKTTRNREAAEQPAALPMVETPGKRRLTVAATTT